MNKRLLHLLISLSIILTFFKQAEAMETSFETDNTLPIVYINLAVKAGTVSDPQNQLGITNFVGEMLLRGTKNKTKAQLDLELDQMGARLEVETRAEALILRGAVLSKKLDSFLNLVNEIVTEPSFLETEIVKLKAEIVSGILEELSHDQSLGARKFNEFLFQDHPYGKPILGKVKDIQNLRLEDILRHYQWLFTEEKLLVVGTGDASEDLIEDWAERLADLRPSSQTGTPIKVSVPAASKTRRVQIVDKPDRTQTQVFGGQVGVRMTDKSFFPLYLGNYAFGGGTFTSRMMLEIRVKRGWSYGANSGFRFGLQPRLWRFHFFPTSENTPESLKFSLAMVEQLKTTGLTKKEFDFSKQSLINGAGFMYDTPQKRVENKLLEKTLELPDNFMKSYAKNLKKVEIEDVNSSLKEFLNPDTLTLTVVGTAKTIKKPLAETLSMKPDEITVTPYTDD